MTWGMLLASPRLRGLAIPSVRPIQSPGNGTLCWPRIHHLPELRPCFPCLGSDQPSWTAAKCPLDVICTRACPSTSTLHPSTSLKQGGEAGKLGVTGAATGTRLEWSMTPRERGETTWRGMGETSNPWDPPNLHSASTKPVPLYPSSKPHWASPLTSKGRGGWALTGRAQGPPDAQARTYGGGGGSPLMGSSADPARGSPPGTRQSPTPSHLCSSPQQPQPP